MCILKFLSRIIPIKSKDTNIFDILIEVCIDNKPEYDIYEVLIFEDIINRRDIVLSLEEHCIYVNIENKKLKIKLPINKFRLQEFLSLLNDTSGKDIDIEIRHRDNELLYIYSL